MIRSCSVLLALALLSGLSLGGQIPEEVEVTRVVSSLRYPAGLAWSRDGFLVIADGEKHEIYRLDADQRAKPIHQDANGAQGIAYDTQSRLYICEIDTRRVVRLDKRGTMTTIAASFEGKKLNSPSDITVRRDGQVYFVDPAFAGAIDRRELSFNGIFHINTKGDIEAIARWRTRPNGIALSADGKELFVSDADRHAVMEFDLDSKGNATNPRDFVKGIQGVPAGLRLDAAGRVYVAAQGVAVYTPDGKLLRTLLNTSRVINCTFGGPDENQFFAATPHDVYRLQIGVKGALQN